MEEESSADDFLEEGLKILSQSKLENNTQLRVGTTLLMRTISLDTVLGKANRSKTVRNMVIPLLHLIKSSSSNPWLSGLSSEWLGDVYFMTDEISEAIKWYRTAKEEFRLAKEDEDIKDILSQDSWSEEEEFFYAYIAVKSYIDATSKFTVDNLEEHSIKKDFEKRINMKLDLLAG